MKAMFVQQQLEFRVEVVGESFYQGQELPCTLTVKNHSAQSQTIEKVYLKLALGTLKLVKEKSSDAFEVLQNAAFLSEDLEPAQLGPQQTKSWKFTFGLDINCVVTEKSQSLFLLFGSEAIAGAGNHALVTVQTHPHIKKIFEILESAFQFVFKSEKSAHGSVVAKFKPPTAQKFSILEELTLSVKFEADALLLKYLFSVKKFQATDAQTIGLKKSKSEVSQRIEAGQYLAAGGFINHAALEDLIGEALGKV